MDNTLVADKLKSGVLEAGQVNMKSLTESGGWFTRTNAAGVQADTIVSDVINDAYKTRLDGFGTNAKRMFTDIKNKALEMDTYINDEQIGSFVESNQAASSYRNDIMEYAGEMDYTGSQKFQIKTEIPDLGATGDYKLFNPNEPNSYVFNGNETFGKQPATKNFFQKNAKKLKDLTKSILAPSGDAPQAQGDIPLTLDTSKIDMAMSTYRGTDQEGSEGGSLVAKVYGQDAANRLLSYPCNYFHSKYIVECALLRHIMIKHIKLIYLLLLSPFIMANPNVEEIVTTGSLINNSEKDASPVNVITKEVTKL